MARQAGRWLGRLRLTTQDALDQLKDETDLKELNLPDLRIGSLRSQARDYVRELMDVEGQMAELEQGGEQIKAALDAEQNGGPKGTGRGPPRTPRPMPQATPPPAPPTSARPRSTPRPPSLSAVPEAAKKA